MTADLPGWAEDHGRLGGFSADWVHGITRQKVIMLEPGPDYPVCVAFGGDSPVEHPSEHEPEEPELFDQAAVNTALAGILRS
jgi:hypothetical protein